MAIGNTNVKFSDLQTEFGGSNPINLSEYYRGGSYFKTNYFNHASYGTPSSSGQIKVGSFSISQLSSHKFKYSLYNRCECKLS